MIDYKIDLDRRLIWTTMTGILTYGDVALHLQRLLRDPAYDASFNDLVTFCPGCMPSDMAELLRLGELARSAARRRPGARWGVVIPDEFRRSLANVCLAVVPERLIAARVFPSVATAEEWLTTDVAPAEDADHERDDAGWCTREQCPVSCSYSQQFPESRAAGGRDVVFSSLQAVVQDCVDA